MNKFSSNLLTRINNLISYKNKKKPVSEIYEDTLFSDEEIDLFENFWIQKSLEEQEIKNNLNTQDASDKS